MKLKLLAVGKLKNPAASHWLDDYYNRLRSFVHFQMEEVKEYHLRKGMPVKLAIDFEAEKLSEKIPTGAYVIALDERGKQRTTEDWVSSFERWQQEGRKEIVFLMGGSYGFPDSILRNANEKWALSKLTFPHELARVIFLEQVYRVYTCMRKIPYHHGDPREP